jgi:hypothetical protein
MYITGNIITAEGSTNEKNENVLPARMLDMIRHAVKMPVRIAYSSFFVRFSNKIIVYLRTYINLTR